MAATDAVPSTKRPSRKRSAYSGPPSGDSSDIPVSVGRDKAVGCSRRDHPNRKHSAYSGLLSLLRESVFFSQVTALFVSWVGIVIVTNRLQDGATRTFHECDLVRLYAVRRSL